MGRVLGRGQDKGRTDAHLGWEADGHGDRRREWEREAVGRGGVAGNCFPDPVEVDGSGREGGRGGEVTFGLRCV
jgi:hypothetical protein